MGQNSAFTHRCCSVPRQVGSLPTQPGWSRAARHPLSPKKPLRCYSPATGEAAARRAGALLGVVVLQAGRRELIEEARSQRASVQAAAPGQEESEPHFCTAGGAPPAVPALLLGRCGGHRGPRSLPQPSRARRLLPARGPGLLGAPRAHSQPPAAFSNLARLAPFRQRGRGASALTLGRPRSKARSRGEAPAAPPAPGHGQRLPGSAAEALPPASPAHPEPFLGNPRHWGAGRKLPPHSQAGACCHTGATGLHR